MKGKIRTDYFRIKRKETINYVLSILICNVKSRSVKLRALVDELDHQIGSKPVQVLWIGDNKSITTGEKRNELIKMSKGKYFCFIDDDDYPSDKYVSSILSGIESGKKVITFKGTQNTDGKEDCPFKYDHSAGRNYKKVIDGVRWKIMLPDHLCVWSKDLTIEPFHHKNLSEDHEWARDMEKQYKSDDIYEMDEFLYHYEYDKNESECRR